MCADVCRCVPMYYKVLKRKLRVIGDGGPESFAEFGCMHHSGTLDKTQVPFDIYVKVRALL